MGFADHPKLPKEMSLTRKRRVRRTVRRNATSGKILKAKMTITQSPTKKTMWKTVTKTQMMRVMTVTTKTTTTKTTTKATQVKMAKAFPCMEKTRKGKGEEAMPSIKATGARKTRATLVHGQTASPSSLSAICQASPALPATTLRQTLGP